MSSCIRVTILNIISSITIIRISSCCVIRTRRINRSRSNKCRGRRCIIINRTLVVVEIVVVVVV